MLLLANDPGQLRHGGILEERPKGQLDPKTLANARYQLHCQQRVSAQMREEVVVNPYLSETEYGDIDFGQRHFVLRRRRYIRVF